jgi:hypothetical protein
MKHFILSFLFFISLNNIAQVIEIPWQNCFGGSENDEVFTYDHSFVKVNNGYLMAGTTESDDGDVGSGNQGSSDVWIIKTDDYGNLIWEKTMGGSLNEDAHQIIKYSEDVFYLVGRTASNDGDVQSGNKGYEDVWLVKINGNGAIIWEKTFGGSKRERRSNMQLTEEGDILILTRTSSNDGDLNYDNPDGSSYIWFYKVSSEGELLWSEIFGGYGPNYASNFLQTTDGGYLILGSCRGVNGGCICNHHNAGDNYYSDIWLIKLNADREIEWQECYGGNHYDVAYDLIEEENYYTILGQSDSNNDQVGYNFGDRDIWFLRISKNGEYQYSKVLGGTLHERPLAFFKSGNTYTLFAHTESNNYDVSGNHSFVYNSDIWYVVIDTLGNLQYQRCIGNQGDQRPGGILKLNEGQYIISATSNVLGYDDIECPRPYPYSKDDIWFFELFDCNQNPPAIPTQPIGQDTVCTINTTQTLYTTQIINPQIEETEWQLLPSEAGALTNLQDSAIIQWEPNFEGQAELRVKSTSSCGESEYSEAKLIEVRSCVGIGELKAKELKIYPNPANNQITFELPAISKESILQIKDIFGKTIAELTIAKGQTQLTWDCSTVSSGVYFYYSEMSDIVYRGKIVLN